jgi:hypothetical protein
MGQGVLARSTSLEIHPRLLLFMGERSAKGVCPYTLSWNHQIH